MDKLGLALHLADTLLTDGGFSFDQWTEGTPRTGYAVSVNPECNRQYVGRVSPLDVYDYMHTFDSILGEPGKVFGAWRDSETGITHLDVSTVVADSDKALTLAREHGEIAVWDYANGAEIRTDSVSV